MVTEIIRAAEWFLVMEGIYGTETQTDQAGQAEESENQQAKAQDTRGAIGSDSQADCPLEGC